MAETPKEILMFGKQDAAFYLKRGKGFLDKNDFDKALADFNKAIDCGGKTIGLAYYFRAVVNAELNNDDQMVADFHMAADYGDEEAIKKLSGKYTPTTRTPPPSKKV